MKKNNTAVKIMLIGSTIIFLTALILEFIGLWLDNEYLISGAFGLLLGGTVGNIAMLIAEKVITNE